MTYADTYKPQRSHSGGVFVFIILIALAAIGVATINIFLGNHAMEQHPDTAPLPRVCIQKNGVWKAFQEGNRTRIHSTGYAKPQ